MLAGRSLKRAGSAIRSRPGGCAARPSASRDFSSQLHSKVMPKLSVNNTRKPQAGQLRSLSLFGWGGNQNTTAKSNVQTPSATAEGTGQASITSDSPDTIRTVKASHATSDVPEPATPHLPNGVESTFVENAHETLLLPKNELASEILSGQRDVSEVIERVGYLKEELGLNFGWGPTAVMQWVTEHMHITAGLTWTTSIIITAALLRGSMVPAMVMAQKESAKMQEIMPIIKPKQLLISKYMKEGDQQKAAMLYREVAEIRKEADFKFSRVFVPTLIQFPFQFGAFRLLRNMGDLPVPALLHEDWLWNHDLSLSDPYFLAPAISSGFIYLTFQYTMKRNQLDGSMAANPMLNPGMIKIFGTLFPALSFVFMIFQPGTVQLYFATSSFFAFVTTAVMRNKLFRNMVGLRPLGSGSSGGPTPPGTINVNARTVTGGSQSTSTSKSTSTTAAAAAVAAGGLQRKPSTQTEHPTTLEKTGSSGGRGGDHQDEYIDPDRSWLDKNIDRFNSSEYNPVKRVKDGWDQFQGTDAYRNAQGKMEKKQAEQLQARQQKFERDRRAILERERRARNEEARAQSRSRSHM